eukprot:Gb_38295 [translate_table: standard]
MKTLVLVCLDLNAIHQRISGVWSTLRTNCQSTVSVFLGVGVKSPEWCDLQCSHLLSSGNSIIVFAVDRSQCYSQQTAFLRLNVYASAESYMACVLCMEWSKRIGFLRSCYSANLTCELQCSTHLEIVLIGSGLRLVEDETHHFGAISLRNLKSIHQALGTMADLLEQMNEKQQKVRHPPLEEGYAPPHWDKKRSEGGTLVKKLCVDDIDHLSSSVLVRETTCYTAPQKSAQRFSGSPNLSTCFAAVTNQKCSVAFRTSNLEILLKNPAPNDSMWKGPVEEGLLESKKHDPESVHCVGGQSVLIVGTLAIDLSCINYDNPFVLTVGPMVIDTRVCDLRVPTLGTMAISTIAVDSNIPDLDMYRNLEDDGQKIKGKLTGLEFQDQESFYWKSNIDSGMVPFSRKGNENMNCHWNFNNMIMIKAAEIESWSELFSKTLSCSVPSGTQIVLKDFVSQGLDLQAIQKESRLSVERQQVSTVIHDLKLSSSWTVTSLSKVESLGWENPADAEVPAAIDIAVIMYTNGSSGLPKRVVTIHGNVIATVVGVMTIVLSLWSAIGYGLPLSLTDTSNKIKKGTKGDAVMLGPTFMSAVPAISD